MNLIDKILGIKGYLIAGAAVILALGASYYVGDMRGYHRAELKCAKQEQRVQTQIVNHYITETKERLVRDQARERQLAANVEQLRQSNSALQARLADAGNRGLDPSLSDRLSVGAVSLLNTSALGGTPETDTAGGLDGTFETPSDVTAQDFVSWGLDVTEQYNELASKHDALVDWVNQELINEH